MYLHGEWVVPTSAGRPWLERPPLPQWITIAFAHTVGHFDQEWIVRLPSAVVATLVVLMTGVLATRWFGRTVGMISGLTLATTLEFCRYAWLAEQDIYLCLLVTTSFLSLGISSSRSAKKMSLPLQRFLESDRGGRAVVCRAWHDEPCQGTPFRDGSRSRTGCPLSALESRGKADSPVCVVLGWRNMVSHCQCLAHRRLSSISRRSRPLVV